MPPFYTSYDPSQAAYWKGQVANYMTQPDWNKPSDPQPGVSTMPNYNPADPYGNLPGSTPTSYIGNTPVVQGPGGNWIPTSSIQSTNPAAGTGTSTDDPYNAFLSSILGGGPASGTGASSTGTGASGFNANPSPTTGQGVFGMVPGPVGIPNPFQDLSNVYPGLSGQNAALSGDITSQLGGQLSPGTLKMIQDAQAAQAIRGGMPGTNMQSGTLFGNRSARDLGLTSEQLTNQGIGNYGKTIPIVSGTQTVSPALQTELAMWNAINRSAPDPTQAGNYAQQLFNQYLLAMRQRQSPSRGTGGGGYGGPSEFDQFLASSAKDEAARQAAESARSAAGGFPNPSFTPPAPNSGFTGSPDWWNQSYDMWQNSDPFGTSAGSGNYDSSGYIPTDEELGIF